jgi:hypothetical protein
MTSSQTDGDSFNSFWLPVGATAAAGIIFDEIRVGTNWTEVTPFDGCNPTNILSGPSDQTVNINSSATLNITATGSSPTDQWQLSIDGGSTYVTPVLTATDSPGLTACSCRART